MKKRLLNLLLVSWVLFCSAASQADIVTIPPSLKPGDQYRLVFITLDRTTALSSNIETYDAFVTAQAYMSAKLFDLGTSWRVIGSTSAISAKIHTDTDDSPAGLDGVPIYRLDGAIIANNYDDLWDGAILNPLYVAQDGTILDTCCGTWTGTNANGTAAVGNELGAPDSTVVDGAPNGTGENWIETAPFSAGSVQFLYAISDILTVPGGIEVQGGLIQECAEIGGTTVNVTANPSGFPTSDPIVSIEWFLDAQSQGPGFSLSLFAPLGEHTLSALATTDTGSTVSSSVELEIVDTTAPEPSVSFVDSHGNPVTAVSRAGVNLIQINYSATDVCDSKPLTSAIAGVGVVSGVMVPIQATTDQVILPGQRLVVRITASDAVGNVAEREEALPITHQ